MTKRTFTIIYLALVTAVLARGVSTFFDDSPLISGRDFETHVVTEMRRENGDCVVYSQDEMKIWKCRVSERTYDHLGVGWGLGSNRWEQVQ